MFSLDLYSFGMMPIKGSKHKIKRLFHNFKQYFRNKKFIQQRAKSGFCDVDLMDFNDYIIKLLEDSLKEISNKPDICPEKFLNTPERWRDILLTAAKCLHNSRKENQKNVFADMLKTEGAAIMNDKDNFEDFQKHWAYVESKNQELRIQNRKAAFDLINSHLDYLWY